MTHEGIAVLQGDCLDVMRALGDACIDAIVTDPPYGLGFMGKAWDALPPGLDWARECHRVLKPGGHLLAFGGTRTSHRLACAIEDAGFEIRDSIAWLYGSGFPKSLDVGKAIDKAAGADRVRNLVPTRRGNAERRGEGAQGPTYGDAHGGFTDQSEPITPAAQQWQGWGTALKPAHEPIVVARKPLIGTVAANVLAHGTGAIHVDACRIDTDERIANHHGTNGAAGNTYGTRDEYVPGSSGAAATHSLGRWPANVVLDESQAAALDTQSGTSSSSRRTGKRTGKTAGTFGAFVGQDEVEMGHDDTGGASRFFYCAKAPSKERPSVGGVSHPTVKPLALMRWLVRLVAVQGAVVLDPFAGSGTTAQACAIEGMRCIAIERDETYLPLIEARLAGTE